MTDDKELALLYDLVRLLRRHGPMAFESLAKRLESGEAMEPLAQVLGRMSQQVGQPPRQSRSPQTSDLVPLAIQRMRTSQPEKYHLLMDFHACLLNKTLLPTVREVRAFAEENAVTEVKATSRGKAIGPLLAAMARLPVERLRNLLDVASQVRTDDRSLQAWSHLILEDQRRLPRESQGRRP